MQLRQLIFIVLLMLGAQGIAHDGNSHDNQAGTEAAEVQLSALTQPEIKQVWGKDYFPNTQLVTQDGDEVGFFDDLIAGKVVAINFIYTSCGDTCPLETAQLRRVYDILDDRMGKDIFFISISIDPQHDTPDVLKAYMQKFNIGPGWTFLTGNEAEIVQLRKKLGLYRDEQDADTEHNINMIIGNQASGRWMTRSPFENPHILATHLGDWLHNWKPKKKISATSYSEAPEMRNFARGETLFRTRCSACHTFGSDGVGPDLMSVTEVRDPDWLFRWIKEPDKMLAEKDPLATEMIKKYNISMPNMRLNDQDVEAVISYMQTESERLGKIAN